VPVSTRFWRNDHQERWNFESIFRICGETVRVRIQRDTYVFQSHAYGEVFDPNSRDWKIVTSVPYSQMETVSNIHPGARSGDVAPVAFETDEEILLYQVSMILGNDYRGVVQDAIMQKHTWQESETFEESDMIEERWEQEQQ
ncbi:MAG: hypothetical protein GTO55_07470, partial [Armatimonadetes bacterium]|nr:hypothetical protein [Armatimonadota bacterium]NIM24108.1 hypothetical protein [Armatimonadota bacterium]NIM67963.1 hypothetical protein [Armatimonadota bacterium]NIN06192.1 hypothetical protein [Armatimonadota bacterium]NIO97631.1 hypothetical protein [Armatimonadota bacterium]